jgi:biopolymer transport protein ExbD
MLRTGAEAASAKKKAQPAGSVLALDEPQLAISMEADGTLYVDGRRVALRELQSVLGEIWSLTPNRPVLVKGDRRLRYEQVRWLLQSVSAAGFRRAGLAQEKRR